MRAEGGRTPIARSARKTAIVCSTCSASRQSETLRASVCRGLQRKIKGCLTAVVELSECSTMRNGRSGAEGSRTLDLLNAIQALSQLSYGPTRREDGRRALLYPQPPGAVNAMQPHFAR